MPVLLANNAVTTIEPSSKPWGTPSNCNNAPKPAAINKHTMDFIVRLPGYFVRHHHSLVGAAEGCDLLGRRASPAAFPRRAWERSDRSLRQLLQGDWHSYARRRAIARRYFSIRSRSSQLGEA